MKKEIPPGAIAAVVVVVVLLAGFVAYKTFFTDPNYAPPVTPEREKQIATQRANSPIAQRMGRTRKSDSESSAAGTK